MINSLELITFVVAILIINYNKKNDINLFIEGLYYLNLDLGLMFTLILLGSGCFAFLAINDYFNNLRDRSLKFINLSIIGGLFFIVLKMYDLINKLELQIEFIENNFWLYFWFLSLFHLGHVLVGIFLLVYARKKIKYGTTSPNEEILGPVSFWHLCDIAWLLIFSTFYIL